MDNENQKGLYLTLCSIVEETHSGAAFTAIPDLVSAPSISKAKQVALDAVLTKFPSWDECEMVVSASLLNKESINMIKSHEWRTEEIDNE